MLKIFQLTNLILKSGCYDFGLNYFFMINQRFQLCGQFLRQGKRRKLTTQDVERAMRWYNAEPVYGHGAGSNEPGYTRYLHLFNGRLCVSVSAPRMSQPSNELFLKY